MLIINSQNKIDVSELILLAAKLAGNLVKAVVDLDREIMIVDIEMHTYGEAYLLKRGSKQTALWGIKMHPLQYGNENFIEFSSMINYRPQQGNRTRGVESKEIREQIRIIVGKCLKTQ